MLNKSFWWLGLLFFGMTICGIQSLGAWVRPPAAPTQVSGSAFDPASTSAAKRHLQCQPTHWRSAFMHQ